MTDAVKMTEKLDAIKEDILSEESSAEEAINDGLDIEAQEDAMPETEQPNPPIFADDIPQSDLLRMVEAMLFASAAPISPQMMLERLPKGADLNILLPKLQEQYEGHGIELVTIDGHWAFRTAQDVEGSLTLEKGVSKKMSKATLETMAIVAYHQPVTRAEIENIRGVATHKGTLDALMEMGWVKPGRRRETPGRPLTWITTTAFLDHFQLSALTDLPGLEEMKSSGLIDARAAIDTIPDTGDLFDNADIDPEEAMDDEIQSRQDDDAFDEQTYREIRDQQKEGK